MGKKKILGLLFSFVLVTAAVIVVPFVWQGENQSTFYHSGYVLGSGEDKKVDIATNTSYQTSVMGNVRFENVLGENQSIDDQNFVHLSDNSVMALSDGVLLDFADLTSNFINNYYISRNLVINDNNGTYSSNTDSGNVDFGENLWKLSDNKFMVQSPSLKVHFSEEDIREVSGFVEVEVSKDGIVTLLTEENVWTTVSDQCYIETKNNVMVNPITKIIDTGSYKVSMAKLIVTPDDSIVLTQDELRRQIVPELDFEAVDGVDGEIGATGANGASGDSGNDGKDGESGVAGQLGAVGGLGSNGLDGNDGTDGTQGLEGAQGTNGDIGAEGTDGKDGVIGGTGNTGATGVEGHEGDDGTSGSDGKDGEDGELGTTGDDGDDGLTGGEGTGGSPGGSGAPGAGAQVDSSATTALPIMTISDWNVTQSSLKGTIKLNEETTESLVITSSDSTKYNGKIFITDVATGEVFPCYSVTNGEYNEGTIDPDNSGFSEFLQRKDEVWFSTYNNPLKPDTEYKLSVIVYYQMNEQIYSKEFISRVFYTDSTGVQMSQGVQAFDASDIFVDFNEAAMVSLKTAEIYLLSINQNDNFTLASATNGTVGAEKDYTQKATLTIEGQKTIKVNYINETGASSDGTPSMTSDITLNFKDLQPDKTYYARMVIKDGKYTQLTDNILTIRTLKPVPTWSGDVNVYYNRVTGAFEVFRPNVTDNYNGIKEYTYKIFNHDTNELVTTKTIGVYEGEPVQFSNLMPGQAYYAEVELTFDDNQKIVKYSIGKSEKFQSVGDTIPKINLTIEEDELQYDSMKGDIDMTLSEMSKLIVDDKHPLSIEVYADQVLNIKASITSADKDATDGSRYVFKYLESTGNTNYEKISVELNPLLQNTNYTITLSGYLDLNDGNGEMERVIGTVSFRTLIPNPLNVNWLTNTESSSSIAENFSIDVLDSTQESAKPHAINALENGIVTVQLYRGTGYDRMLLGERNYVDKTELEKIFSDEGIEITEQEFGVPALQSDVNYMLVVDNVTDQTYKQNFGYENEYEEINNEYKVLTAKATPPDLDLNPAKGVLYKPIYFIQAAEYGVVVNKELSDDTIIGYTLESNYDNSQRLAKTVTYYLYEYREFFKAIETAKMDPIAHATTLREPITLDIPTSSDDLPKIAVFFDDVSLKDDIEEGDYANGHFLYLGGKEFSRGYRYCFANTIDYSATGGTGDIVTYPNAHSDYKDYAKYGAGKHESYIVGQDTAYVLNSGLVSAPKERPILYSYVYSADAEAVTSDPELGPRAIGNMTVHYKCEDNDGALKSENGEPAQIIYTDTNGVPQTLDFQSTKVSDGAADWYQESFPYQIYKYDASTVVQPNVLLNEYNIDYNAKDEQIMDILVAGKYEPEPFYLVQAPVDWPYGDEMNEANNLKNVQMEMKPHYDENYIEFILTDKREGSNNTSSILASRSYLVKFTFEFYKAGMVHKTKELYLPIVIEDGQNKVKISTAYLGSDIVGMPFNVTASILYDDGSQGWNRIDSSYAQEPGVNAPVMFGLQRMNTYDATKEEYLFALGTYYIPGKSSITPSEGLMKLDSNIDINSLRNVAGEASRLGSTFDYLESDKGSQTIYLGLTEYGVEDSGTTNTEIAHYTHIVPKGMSEYPITNTVRDTVDSITPTIGSIDFETSVNMIKMNQFKLYGAEGIDKVTIFLYESKEDAMSLAPQPVGTMIAPVDTSGNYVVNEGDNLFTGLNKQQLYYMVYTINTNGKNEKLLFAENSEFAISEVETIAGINIRPSSAGALYYNFNYATKYLELEYWLNEFLGVSMEYSIYDSKEAAESTGDTAEEPLIDHETLKNDGIIPKDDSLSRYNKLVMNLTPSQARKLLVPGQTYYLKLKASFANGSEDESEISIVEFTLGELDSDITGLIYANEATSDSLNFTVAISDPNHSLMTAEGTDKEPLYAVRFTTESGKVLETIYDKQLYPASGKQSFLLLNDGTPKSTLTGRDIYTKINSEEKYYINVYAIPDTEHDGLTPVTSLTDIDGNSKLSITDVSANDFEAFKTLINSFWIETVDSANNREWLNDEKMDDIENTFMIATRGQMTTDEKNLLINTNSAVYTANEFKNFELILAESYGITYVDKNDITQQAFKKISYSITGYTDDGTPVKLYGTSLDSNEDPLFVKGYNSAGYDIFTYTIPKAMENGSYTITVNLYETESDIKPFETISRMFIY